MTVYALGLAGGLDAVHELSLDSTKNYTYDAAAVLLGDGQVLQAMEEERLDRLKHSNKFPVASLSHCLQSQGLRLSDLDALAYYVDERSADALLVQLYLSRPDLPQRLTARGLLASTLSQATGSHIAPEKIRFYEHRMTHAACAMLQSGFDEALVYVIDNAGGVYHGRRHDNGRTTIEALGLTEPGQSIQKLCHAILPFLGMELFEEHQAAALATFGDPGPFADLFETLVAFEPGGVYRLKLERVPILLERIAPPRGDLVRSQAHCDLAASLQWTLQRIVLHVISHYVEATDIHRVCVAGGMAENAWTAGAVLSDARFGSVFFHPAAYDSGCALGAALLASQDLGASPPPVRVTSLRWGGNIGSGASIRKMAEQWAPYLRVALKKSDVAVETAALIAQGDLVAVVEGRSNFGTRALGGRNIFCDPSQQANRERTHRALRRKETFRPLTALVRQEDLADWVVLPRGIKAAPFQSYTLPVHEARREELAACMHGDGTVRIQSVSQEQDAMLWAVIGECARLDRPAALLSTSFNCAGEPVVETAADAFSCFLRSEITHLVIGDLICRRGAAIGSMGLSLWLELPPYVRLTMHRGWAERQKGDVRYELAKALAPGAPVCISAQLGQALAEVDTGAAFADLVAGGGADQAELVDEIIGLWGHGFVTFQPKAFAELAE